jgi:hypothetical protein
MEENQDSGEEDVIFAVVNDNAICDGMYFFTGTVTQVTSIMSDYVGGYYCSPELAHYVLLTPIRQSIGFYKTQKACQEPTGVCRMSHLA